MFTIDPADETGTFTWAFYNQGSPPLPNPEFTNPGVGTHLLTYDYVSEDGCTDVDGTIDIELTCSCPCEGPHAINVDAGEGTPWQDTELITYVDPDGNELDLNLYCLNIRGRLLIDDFMDNGLDIDLYIKNGFIHMQPGAEIVVQDGGGLQFHHVNGQDGDNGSGIHGCDYMWEGIDVEEGGHIIVERSTIQDANTAIGITGSADITIKNNRFENNYRGIDIAPLIDPENNDPALFSLTIPPQGLSGNFFATVGNRLKGTVDGSIPRGHKGDVGIKMAYLNFLLARGEWPASANVFENLRHGIYANQSSLIMIGNTFREVDYGARLYNTPAYFLSNIFDNVAISGIESLDAGSLSATNNIMLNMHQLGINYEGAKHLNSYRIRRNRISSKDHCISIEASPNTTHVNVADNNLLLGNDAFPGRAAVRVFNIGNPILNTVQIKNHFADTPGPSLADIYPQHPIGDAVENRRAITINSYGNGIVLENMNNTEIQNNQVVYRNPSIESVESHGIRLEDSEENYLYGNAVQAAEGFSDLRNISLASSSDNELYCNSTDGGGIGVGFFGACRNTDLNTTNISNHDIGLLCEEGAIIGLQEHQGNTWPLDLNGGSGSAEHRGETQAEIDLSIFQVAPPDDSEYWPGSILTPTAGDGVTWFRSL